MPGFCTAIDSHKADLILSLVTPLVLLNSFLQTDEWYRAALVLRMLLPRHYFIASVSVFCRSSWWRLHSRWRIEAPRRQAGTQATSHHIDVSTEEAVHGLLQCVSEALQKGESHAIHVLYLFSVLLFFFLNLVVFWFHYLFFNTFFLYLLSILNFM